MPEEERAFISNFYWVLLLVLFLQIVFSFFQYSSLKIPIKSWGRFLSFLLIVGVSFYIGYRECAIGGDTEVYVEYYNQLIDGGIPFWKIGEPLFYFVMYVFAQFFSIGFFFTFCALIYIGGAYVGMKRFFGSYAIYPLLLFFISPNFFLYGINGVRNGVAASVFLMSFWWWRRNDKKMYIVMFMSILCHYSMVFPLLAFVCAKKRSLTSWLLLVWILAILLYFSGFTLGTVFGDIFPDFGRYSEYLQEQAEDMSVSVRDFFIYGASPIFAGIYYVYIKKYSDAMYIRLLNSYIILSTLYVLVMDVSFAVRFAYLSGFLMPLLLIYPLIKERIWPVRLFLLSCVFVVVFLVKAVKIL